MILFGVPSFEPYPNGRAKNGRTAIHRIGPSRPGPPHVHTKASKAAIFSGSVAQQVFPRLNRAGAAGAGRNNDRYYDITVLSLRLVYKKSPALQSFHFWTGLSFAFICPKEIEWQHKKLLELELPPGVAPVFPGNEGTSLMACQVCQSFEEPGVPKVYSSLWRETIFFDFWANHWTIWKRKKHMGYH